MADNGATLEKGGVGQRDDVIWKEQYRARLGCRERRRRRDRDRARHRRGGHSSPHRRGSAFVASAAPRRTATDPPSPRQSHLAVGKASWPHLGPPQRPSSPPPSLMVASSTTATPSLSPTLVIPFPRGDGPCAAERTQRDGGRCFFALCVALKPTK